MICSVFIIGLILGWVSASFGIAFVFITGGRVLVCIWGGVFWQSFWQWALVPGLHVGRLDEAWGVIVGGWVWRVADARSSCSWIESAFLVAISMSIGIWV